MPTKRVRMGVAVAVLVVPFASLGVADDKEKVEGDLKKLQGTWTSKGEGGETIKYTIEGKKFKVVAPSRSYEMTLTLDPDAKPEKTIDFKIEEGPDDAKGKTSRGIYKFDGEKFVYCFSPQGDRPAKYETEGYEKIVMTLTKEKEKEKKE